MWGELRATFSGARRILRPVETYFLKSPAVSSKHIPTVLDSRQTYHSVSVVALLSNCLTEGVNNSSFAKQNLHSFLL
jgi:hypothetical protein